MKSRQRVFTAAVAFAVAICAWGCGSGEPAEATILSGVASTEAAISGTVSLKDSSEPAREESIPASRDGAYSFDVSALTPPYFLKVAWAGESGEGSRLYAIATAPGTANINPFTDAVVAGAADGASPDDLYERSDHTSRARAADRLAGITAALRTALAPLLDAYSVGDPVAGAAASEHDALRALLQDVQLAVAAGSLTVVNRQSGAVIFSAPINDIGAGVFYLENLPTSQQGAGDTTDEPLPPACIFSYSEWGACDGGTQTRELVSSAPAGCVGTPSLSQTCAVAVPVCVELTYSDWGDCAGGVQTRTVVAASPVGCAGGTPILSQSCTVTPPAPPTCTSFTYSAWGACSGSVQTRTVASASPQGCTAGSPVLSQACTSTIDGAALYAQYCSSCHGNSKKGASAAAIQSAINSNRGGMGSAALRALTPEQLSAIASAP